MTTDRRAQIEALCEQALARDLSARGAFLDEACQNDPVPRVAVTSV